MRNNPLISLIGAMASNRVIGHRGGIPWKIPGEQKMFKAITLGHAVIMGRITYESLSGPLPGRTNIVVTRQTAYRAPGCKIVHDLAGAIQTCPNDENEAFVIGGSHLYREAMPIADRIYLTVLPIAVKGDTRFPKIPEAEFVIKSSRFFDTVEPYHFYIYERAIRF